MAHAFLFDTKIIVEEFIAGRELECAVLGNQNPEASVVGEIIPHHEFYSYDAKYIDEDGASLVIPADIPTEAAERLRSLAIAVFKTLSCEGLARVDFFLYERGYVVCKRNKHHARIYECKYVPKALGRCWYLIY